MKASDTRSVGVIGAGSFGTAVANLLAQNCDVLLYSRKEEKVAHINEHHQNAGVVLADRIRATNDVEEIAARCTLVFPIVPSASFRQMMRTFGPHLKPYHIVIHGTKGFDLLPPFREEELDVPGMLLSRAHVRTMSEVILEESSAVRVGCIAGPNLAREILDGKPSAAVVASRFREVIQAGQAVLSCHKFRVFGTYDLLGAELAGAFKNIIALGSGILDGYGLGRNIQGLLIARGLAEMVNLGKALGASSQAFIGVAGIGDLVTTATSPDSRNYQFGIRLAQGENVEQIRSTLVEPAEGVRTLRVARQLVRQYRLHSPIIEVLHTVVFERFPIDRAIEYLMSYPYSVDVDFL